MFANVTHFQTKIRSRFVALSGKSQACVWDEVRVENPVQIRLIVLIRPIRLDFAEYTFTLAQNGVAQAPRALLSIVECVC